MERTRNCPEIRMLSRVTTALCRQLNRCLPIFGAAVLTALSSSAQAGIIITMSEAGVVGPTVVETTAANSAFFNGTFGDYTISVNTAVTNSPGVNGIATLNVSSTETRGVALAGSSGILTIDVQATQFTEPIASTAAILLQSIASNSSSSTATMTFQSSLNGSPALLQGPLAQGTSDTILFPYVGPISPFPFTISNTTSIHVAPGLEGSTSGSTEVANFSNFTTSPTPEPASMIMLVGGLATACGFGAVRRRRMATR
jgi:hypothetical protein